MKIIPQIALASTLLLLAIPAQAQIPDTELFRLIVIDTINVGVKICNVQLDPLVRDQLSAGLEIAKKRNPNFSEAQYSELTKTLVDKLKEDQVSVCHDYESTNVSELIDKVMGAK